MISNTNHKTGIPFGIVALNNLDGDISHELMFGFNAVNVSYQEYLDECEAQEVEPDEDVFIEESNYEGTYQGVQYGISWLGGAPLLWVYESPHITSTAAKCSPCCPNAGDLNNEGDYTCYTIPDDWWSSYES